MRLDPTTPARQSFREVLRPGAKRRVGRPAVTWIECITKDLEIANITLDRSSPDNTIRQLIQLTADRDNWHAISRYIMQGNPARDRGYIVCWTDVIPSL